MVMLDFCIYPLGKGECVCDYVSRVIDLIDQSGLAYRCHDMGTTIEGDWEPVWSLVQRCFQAMAADCDRVECSIQIDYRKGTDSRLTRKVAAVEEKLGRSLKK